MIEDEKSENRLSVVITEDEHCPPVSCRITATLDSVYNEQVICLYL